MAARDALQMSGGIRHLSSYYSEQFASIFRSQSCLIGTCGAPNVYIAVKHAELYYVMYAAPSSSTVLGFTVKFVTLC